MSDAPYEPPVDAPLPPPLPVVRTAWNAWWTWLWAIVLFLLWQIVMTAGVFIALATTGAMAGNLDARELTSKAEELALDGDVLGVIAFANIFFVCPACWLLGHLRKGWTGWEYLGKAKVRWWQWPLWAFITIASSIIFGLLAPSLGIEGPDPSMVSMAQSTQFPFLLFLGVAIGAPLFEEFIFRGVLFRGWRESRLGLTGTLILTSFCWAALHLQYPIVVIGYIFVLGLLLGLARELTGSLWIPVWMHFVNNSIASLSMFNL